MVRKATASETPPAASPAVVQDLASIAQMAAGLAHEIRNPLAGIQGVIEVLRDQSRDQTQHQVLCEVLKEVGRIDQLVRELICFAKPQYHQLRPLRLDQLVDRVARRLSHERRSSLDVEVSGNPRCVSMMVMADENCISHVLEHLISNSLDAVEDRGTLRLVFSCDERTLTLRLEDDGPGIPSEMKGKIFQPFYTTKASGTGLGLALCRRLVGEQGGTLDLDEDFEDGAAFILSLPLPDPCQEAPAVSKEA
ncbi:MAG TPA: ATP-binding protein [Acidobacteriota bacterium]|nr:ATP-binding protein [Acidobacteriota bacterium]